MTQASAAPDLAARMAALHALVFTGAARWSRASFATALADPGCFHVTAGDAAAGFLLGRAVAGEAELLTLAVAPTQRRRGHGRRLLAAFETEARRRGADRAFLEVDAANAPACALYAAAGWQEAGRRRGYYEGRDALTFDKPLGEQARTQETG